MPMRHKTRRRRIRNLFSRKRIKNAYSFKKMRLVRGGNWFSDLFAENPLEKQRKELIETAKNEYLSSHPEPTRPEEYSKLHDTLLREPTRFHMQYPWGTNPKDREYTDKLQKWYYWAMGLREETMKAANLHQVY
jgi:hypothetical protein